MRASPAPVMKAKPSDSNIIAATAPGKLGKKTKRSVAKAMVKAPMAIEVLRLVRSAKYPVGIPPAMEVSAEMTASAPICARTHRRVDARR